MGEVYIRVYNDQPTFVLEVGPVAMTTLDSSGHLTLRMPKALLPVYWTSWGLMRRSVILSVLPREPQQHDMTMHGTIE